MSVNLYHNHYFNVDIAVECGVDAAAIFSNIVFWIQYNTKEKLHFYDGRHWMHETAEHMLTHMPYLSVDRIKKAIPVLIEKGYLIKGHFDKNKFNRCNYYSLPDSQKQERDKPNSKKIYEGAKPHDEGCNVALPESAIPHVDHIDDIKEQDKINNNNKGDDVVVGLEKKEQQKSKIPVIAYKKSNGTVIEMPESEIYKYFANTKCPSAFVSQAIEQAKQYKGVINNLIGYIETICRNLVKSSFSSKTVKNTETTISTTSKIEISEEDKKNTRNIFMKYSTLAKHAT